MLLLEHAEQESCLEHVELLGRLMESQTCVQRESLRSHCLLGLLLEGSPAVTINLKSFPQAKMSGGVHDA